MLGLGKSTAFALSASQIYNAGEHTAGK